MRLAIRRYGKGSEAGETLIEVVMTVALMGIVVLAVLGGIGTMLLGSAAHREHSSANAVLVSAMERVKSLDTGRTTCARGADYLSAARQATLPQAWIDRPWTATDAFPDNSIVVSYETGNPVDQSSGGTKFFNDAVANCKDNGTYSSANTLTLQLITITVTAPGGHATQALSFIKGDN